MRPLLSLVMILKNEAGNIAKTLASARPYIDCWTIVDTGSTDGTQEIVQRELRDVPGALHEEAFVDFATTRNRALELDAHPYDIAHSVEHQPVFTLTMSGDEVLEDGDKLRAFLETKRDAADGAYLIERSSGPQVWPFPLILRTDAKWRYERKVHERPVAPSGDPSDAVPLAPGRVVHTLSDLERRKKRVREFDVPVLTAEVADESRPLGERAQDMFFLADAHSALAAESGDDIGGPKLTHQLTAMSLYWRYHELCMMAAESGKGPRAEAERKSGLFALFRFFTVAERCGFFNSAEMLSRLVPLAEQMPNTPEVHYMVAQHAATIDSRQGLMLAERAAKIAAEASKRPVDERLPYERRVEWCAWRLAAGCAKELKNDRRARDLAERALAAGAPEEAVKEFLA